VWHWPLSDDYNRYQLAEKDAHYLDSLRTVSFLVIRRDSHSQWEYGGGDARNSS
jgi:hypothetical protein